MIQIEGDRIVIESKNQKLYAQEAERMRCPRYDPCPICYKCRNRAAHLFVKCQICRIPADAHTERDRNFMIRRENFSPRFELPSAKKG